MTITNATSSIIEHIFRIYPTNNQITNDTNEYSKNYAFSYAMAKKVKNEWTESAQEAYKKETKQKIQKNKIFHHSIAIGLTESQGMQDAEKLAQWLEAKLGTKIYAVAIHNDEGYLKRKDGYRLVSGKNCFFDRKSGEYFFDANKTQKINMAEYEIIKNRHAHIEFSGFRQDGSSLNHFDFESKKNDTKSRFLRLGTSTFRKAYHKQLEILGFKQEPKEYEYNFDATKLKNTARKEFLFLLNKESYEPESLTEAEVKKLENYKMRTNFEARERAQENENLLKNADKQNKILQAENEYLKNANDTTQNILESFVSYQKLRDNEEKRLTDEKESLKNQNADLQAELESVKAEWLPKSVVKKIIEQERKAWIAEQGHTAEDYKDLKALNKQQYSDIETLKSEIESLKQQLAQKPKEVAKEVVKEVIVEKEIPVKIPVKVKDTEHEQALEVKEQELKTIAHNLTARENDIKNKEAELKEKEKILNATIAQNKAIEDNTAKLRDEILVKDEKINKLESQELSQEKTKNRELQAELTATKKELESAKSENETLKKQLENKSLTELENIKTQMQEDYNKQLDTLKREYENKINALKGKLESKNYEEATQEHLENIKRDIDKKEMQEMRQERNERIKSLNDKVEKLIAEQQNRAKSTETHQESKNDDEDDNIHRNH